MKIGPVGAFFVVLGSLGALFAGSALFSALGDAASQRSDAGVLGLFAIAAVIAAAAAAAIVAVLKNHQGKEHK